MRTCHIYIFVCLDTLRPAQDRSTGLTNINSFERLYVLVHLLYGDLELGGSCVES